MMKKTFIPAIASALLMLFASCQKTAVNKEKGDGFLTFEDFSLDLDETVITKAAVAADGTYRISIIDADGVEIINKPYSEVKNNDNKISLPAGAYTLVAASQVEVPESAFERPVYGTSKAFAITAGEVTNIGQLVCQLLQCKVTVDYNDEFLAAVTGPGTTTVTLKAGYPLEYALNADKTYNKNAGYFAVEGNTMEVVFSGSINGKLQKMRKTLTGIEARQWRQIKFIQKKNEQGNATFAIAINDLVSDEVLNNVVTPKEDVIDSYDPQAPKGDGGITLDFDYDAGCDAELTDLNNMLIVPKSIREMCIKLKAVVPNGILKFNVAIESDSDAFKLALSAANAFNLDLINPLSDHDVIFKVVPFPHGAELSGKTEVEFDLSAAQAAITAYPGTHTFMMTIVDKTFCSKNIPVTMIVE
jgi:hypothetical protein